MGDLTQISDNISINNPYMTIETLKLDNDGKLVDNNSLVNNDGVLVNNNTQINVKFPLPKVKIENNFPTSDKPLTSVMKDYILLTETTGKYAVNRYTYLEEKLDEERIRSMNKYKVKKVGEENNEIIHLGSDKNIELNITNLIDKNNVQNRLRCTWIYAGESFPTLVDTGASHSFIKEDQVNKITPNLILNKRKY